MLPSRLLLFAVGNDLGRPRLTDPLTSQCLHRGHRSKGLNFLFASHPVFLSLSRYTAFRPSDSVEYSETNEEPGKLMDERDFFDERPEKKPATLNCPHCHQAAEYEVTWLVRTKKRQLAGRADERDRARFAKARSYMMRKDDVMGCKNVRCRKRFDISGLQSVVFTD
jgi:hypothetical protein